MATRESNGKNVAFYALNAKASATETPHFVLSKKEGETWTKTDVGNEMFGIFLVSAEIREKENKDKGTKFNVFILTVQDEKETCELTLTHNSITYLLINSLASDCNKLEEYSFIVGKKQDGKYWNGTCYVNIKNHSKSLQWHIDFKAAPRKEPVMTPDPSDPSKMIHLELNGAKVWNDSKLKAFWENIFKSKIIGALGSGNVPAPTPPSSNTEQPPVVFGTNEDDDGLPF